MIAVSLNAAWKFMAGYRAIPGGQVVTVRSHTPLSSPAVMISGSTSGSKRRLVAPSADSADADAPFRGNLGGHRTLCFLTSQELGQAASVSRAVRLSVGHAIAAWHRDLSGGAARVPLPCMADPGGGHGTCAREAAGRSSCAVEENATVRSTAAIAHHHPTRPTTTEPFPSFVYTEGLVGSALTPARRAAAKIEGCRCIGGVCELTCDCAQRNPSAWAAEAAAAAAAATAKTTVAALGEVPAPPPLIYTCHAGCSCACAGRPSPSPSAADADSQPAAPPRCPFREVEERREVVVKWLAGKGWGLVTPGCLAVGADATAAADSVPAGAVLATYGGELISRSEAEARHERNRRDGRMNFIMTLVERSNGGTLRTTIDAAQWGSAGRFANHSCAPNCGVRLTRSGSLLPEVKLYALRPIQPGEELTFDYGREEGGAASEGGGGTRGTGGAGGGGGEEAGGSVCRCGAKSCRGFLPFQPG